MFQILKVNQQPCLQNSNYKIILPREAYFSSEIHLHADLYAEIMFLLDRTILMNICKILIPHPPYFGCIENMKGQL